MDDSFRVRGGERARDVADDRDDFGNRQRTALLHLLAQRLALHERHDVVRDAVAIAGREHGNDVRLLQSRGELDLPAEALDAHARGEIGRQNFDDDAPIETDLARGEDSRHAAAAELALDRVGAAEGLW